MKKQNIILKPDISENSTWLDQVCFFKKANGLTWRQLAENKSMGEKFKNGKEKKGRQYLHSLKFMDFEEIKEIANFLLEKFVKNDDGIYRFEKIESIDKRIEKFGDPPF